MANNPLKVVASAKSGFIDHVWSRNLKADPWWKATLYHILRTVHVIVRDLADGQLTLRAMSLVFTTILSLVPLLAISFSVLKGFGVHNQIEPMLLNMLEPLGEKGLEISQRIIEFVENMKVGVLGSLGLALLLYTVISLTQKIERAFNYTWHVRRQRPLAQRFSDYLSVILVGPVLIVSSVGISASVTSFSVVEQMMTIAPVGLAIELAGRVVPFFLSVAAFTFLYVFIPNTKVRVGSAFFGAIAAGILWKITGWVFASFIVTSTKYAAIYSAFATLIFFMLWLYLSWLILMVGAAVAFYHQHPEYLNLKRGERHLSGRVREKLALAMMRLIGGSFYQRQPAWSAEGLSSEVHVPMEATTTILEQLEVAGLIARTGDDQSTYLPARPLEATSIKEVIDAVKSADEEGYITLDDLPAEKEVDTLRDELDEAVSATLGQRTLKDLALAESQPEPAAHPLFGTEVAASDPSGPSRG
jgi:membrane protein